MRSQDLQYAHRAALRLEWTKESSADHIDSSGGIRSRVPRIPG